MTSLFGDDELTGEVVGMVYASADGYGVIELDAGADGGARCTGPLASVIEGQVVRLVGRWTEHPIHGRTFAAVLYEQVMPTTPAGLRSLLTSSPFDLDPPLVDRVVACFGSDTGRVIEHEPDRLAQAGLDPSGSARLHAEWMRGLALAALVRLVEPAGLPLDVVRAAHARFGPDVVQLVRENPFALLEVDRCTFDHADAVGRLLEVDPLDPRRLSAGSVAALRAARRREGHQCVPMTWLVTEAARLLRVDPMAARAGLDHAVASGALVVDLELELDGSPAVYTTSGHAAEVALATDLRRLAEADGAATFVQAHPSEELTAGQATAVLTAFSTPVSVLTGGPGTGKTRTVREIVLAAVDAHLDVALCAPTGRAAKRLEELVGHAATTVHRLLEARPARGGGFVFQRGRDDPLPHDMVIVDELSMCDTALAVSLVAAVRDRSHVVLVGDPDQLPPVGPGDVLSDLIRSEVVPVVELTEIHRQAAGSRIVALAREINAGEVGGLAPVDGDVFLAEEPDRARIVGRVVEAVATRAPAYFGVDVSDVQVVSPIYRGPAGVDALNTALRASLNPPDGLPTVAGFVTGDRVLQTRNDADLDVANGDIGTVVDVTPSRARLRVAFPRGEVTYDREAARALTHAWAVTVHKSQGGEWPVVVLVCDRAHRGMLYRQLLYTAVTRAQHALIVVGQQGELRDGSRREGAGLRWTGLSERLQLSAAGTSSVRPTLRTGAPVA